MKTTNPVLISLLALGASAWMASAQEGGGPPPNGDRPPPREGPGGPGGPGRPGRRPPPVPPVIAALDANHDGVIDEQEIANASAALKTLDKNGDGKLTLDELLPPLPKRNDNPGAPGDSGKKGPRPPLPPVIVALDTNHDGVIDEQEIANASTALKTLDKNGDGKLTPDELRPPFPPRGNGVGGPGPHDGPPPPHDCPPGPPPADQ